MSADTGHLTFAPSENSSSMNDNALDLLKMTTSNLLAKDALKVRSEVKNYSKRYDAALARGSDAPALEATTEFVAVELLKEAVPLLNTTKKINTVSRIIHETAASSAEAWKQARMRHEHEGDSVGLILGGFARTGEAVLEGVGWTAELAENFTGTIGEYADSAAKHGIRAAGEIEHKELMHDVHDAAVHEEAVHLMARAAKKAASAVSQGIQSAVSTYVTDDDLDREIARAGYRRKTDKDNKRSESAPVVIMPPAPVQEAKRDIATCRPIEALPVPTKVFVPLTPPPAPPESTSKLNIAAATKAFIESSHRPLPATSLPPRPLPNSNRFTFSISATPLSEGSIRSSRDLIGEVVQKNRPFASSLYELQESVSALNQAISAGRDSSEHRQRAESALAECRNNVNDAAGGRHVNPGEFLRKIGSFFGSTKAVYRRRHRFAWKERGSEKTIFLPTCRLPSCEDPCNPSVRELKA